MIGAINAASFDRGYKSYELSNHLGNVLVTVSDRKLAVSTDGITIDYYIADVVNAQDYYPFGMLQPGRSFSSAGSYRYGFNGKENDNEVKGIEGSQQDYGMRIYDPRVGRFLSVDPLTPDYPELTPYQFTDNSPIENIDLDGLEQWSVVIKGKTRTTYGPWTYKEAAKKMHVLQSTLIRQDEERYGNPFKPKFTITNSKNVPKNPVWVENAKKEIGQKEIKGSEHNPRIVEYHQATSGKFKDDETPWCSSFCNWVMKKSGIKGTNSAMASSWKSWGQKLDKAAYGAVAVIDWGGGKGHVGIVVGKQGNNIVVLLGGNQGDQVKYSTFKESDIKSYRMPAK